MRRIATILLVVAAISSSMAATVDSPGKGKVSISGVNLSVSPRLFGDDWQLMGTLVGGGVPEEDGSRVFRNGAPAWDGATNFTVRLSTQDMGDGAVLVSYCFNPVADLQIKELSLIGDLVPETWSGGRIVADGVTNAIQSAAEIPNQSVSRTSRKFELLPSDQSRPLRIEFDRPVQWIFIKGKDSRMSVRFVVATGPVWKKQEMIAVSMFVRTDEPLESLLVPPYVFNGGKGWTPVTVKQSILPGSALDFSALTEAPAGKYGRVVAVGDHFEFAGRRGEPVRFYGVNLTFTANFLPREEAREFARHLRRLGYNAVRLHHVDGYHGLTYRSRGNRIHPERMALLDATCAAMIEEGLYITTDLYVGRNEVTFSSLGIDLPGKISQRDYKVWAMVDPRVFDDLKAFAKDWLTHVNLYTGRSYAAEPALMSIAFLNENNYALADYWTLNRCPAWREKWTAWVVARKKSNPGAYADVDGDSIPRDLSAETASVAAFVKFVAEVESDFFARMRSFLQDELKCGAMFTDFSGGPCPMAYMLPRAKLYDYVDNHYYFDHPIGSAGGLPSACHNENPVRRENCGLGMAAFSRVLGKPYSIGEFNYCAPNSYRGAGGLIFGAMAALQDWSSVYRFEWIHRSEMLLNPDAYPVTFFATATDPIASASERAAVCLFRRGDISPLVPTITVGMPDISFNAKAPVFNKCKWNDLDWCYRVGVSAGQASERNESYDVLYRKSRAEMVEGLGPLAKVGGGAVSIDPDDGTFTVETARTCGALVDDGKRIEAGLLVVDVRNGPATVWVSSCDGRDLKTSRRILLTHLTDVKNVGAKYVDRKMLRTSSHGGPQKVMRNGIADVMLMLPRKKRKVYALGMDGARRYEVPFESRGDGISFRVDIAHDPAEATYLYEIANGD